jgi:hypothetical protein
MTKRSHPELLIQELPIRAADSRRNQAGSEVVRTELNEDVGSLRLALIEAVMKEARADRTDE